MKTKLTHIQILGICLLPVTMVIFHLVPHSRSTMEGAALLNYPIAIVYFLLSFADRPKNTKLFKAGQPRLNVHIFLSLMLISCFTLNKDIHIFAITPTWLKIFLPIALSAFIVTGYKGYLPKLISNLSSLIVGIGILVYLYYAFVLMPFSPFALLGIFLIGLSFHLLIPALLVTYSLIATFKSKYVNANRKWVLGGISIATIFIFVYSGLYCYHDKQIKGAQKNLVLNKKNSLPEWVIYAQNCTSEYWTKRIIGKKLLYEIHSDSWFDFNFSGGSFSEIREHDPLVATAALLTDNLSLENKERVKILSSINNTRHFAYEKLWSGRDLKVNKELTDVRIYPDYRMAYFEKTIWIENTSSSAWNQQEALFTFNLPDGAVASSLSLWIDGKEEKSRLTTRKKATNAYRTIVGKERRDPVVLHWQEGNRLTATIFPCTPKEPRRVKIGITAPLLKKGNRLFFENMKVQGPNNKGADEIIHVKFVGQTQSESMPNFMSEEMPNQYIYEGKPVYDWSCSVEASPISENTFTFNNKTWQLKNIKYKKSKTPSSIYLDINKTWSKNDVMFVLSHVDGIPVYVHDNNDFILLELTNFNSIFNKLSKRPFSLLPVFKIKNPESALIITKGNNNSPIPSELKNSLFYNSFLNHLSKENQPISTIILNGEKSPYTKALEEFKLIDCRNKTLEQLRKTKLDYWFRDYNRYTSGVNIPMSEIAIIPASNVNNNLTKVPHAPSHLLRLFNYHSVMQKAGHLFLQEEAEIPDSVYSLCNEAFIVTPVSSLIVLESQKDYERFDIKENKNSLKNANLQDSGAVPEPHEWALIITLGLIISFIYFRFR